MFGVSQWLGSTGHPVKTQPIMIQIDVPAEQPTDASSAAPTLGAPNLVAIIAAVVQLFLALKANDPLAIAAAIQALIKAITG